VVVEMLRAVGVGAVLAGEITTGTACDAAIVCVFCTCNLAVLGVARLLGPTVPDNVLASTTVVATAVPFQRIAA
jgi:hypothetical protein